VTGALFTEKNPQVVRARLSDVLAIANAEKEALGFLANAAYEQSADRRRLHLAFDGEEVVGFALFGSAFPHARVQQIGVQSSRRRRGIGSLLLKGLFVKRVSSAAQHGGLFYDPGASTRPASLCSGIGFRLSVFGSLAFQYETRAQKRAPSPEPRIPIPEHRATRSPNRSPHAHQPARARTTPCASWLASRRGARGRRNRCGAWRRICPR
jgi:GNAT superfamily N-acetyltransferase